MSSAVLIVGPVTWDVSGGARRPGGAVAFAARTAAAMGVRAAILTVAGPDADLSALEGHDVHVVPAPETLTFEHRHTAGGRRLRVLAMPRRTLTAPDLPSGWGDITNIILAPLLADDLDAGSFPRVGGVRSAILAQGMQRRTGVDGGVEEMKHPSDSLMGAISSDSSVFLSDAETRSWPREEFDAVVARSARLVVTRGREGASIHRDGTVLRIPPFAAEVADTTGAGDVFATAFILALSHLHLDEWEAGLLASAYAAASVETAGPTPLPPLSEVERRMAAMHGSVRA